MFLQSKKRSSFHSRFGGSELVWGHQNPKSPHPLAWPVHSAQVVQSLSYSLAQFRHCCSDLAIGRPKPNQNVKGLKLFISGTWRGVVRDFVEALSRISENSQVIYRNS